MTFFEHSGYVAQHELVEFARLAAILLAVNIPLVMSKVKLPRRLQIECVGDGQLTPAQREFFAAYDLKLRELGYEPFATHRTTNLPLKALQRTYLSSSDTARCSVIAYTSAKGLVQFQFVQFITDYADDSEVMTTNYENSRMFSRQPDKFVQRCMGIDDVSELKRRHDAFAADYRNRGPVFTDPRTFIAEQQRRWDKEAAFYISQKQLQFNAARDQYAVTLAGVLRFHYNLLNPFADNFTWRKMALGLAAACIPIWLGLQPSHTLQSLTLAYAALGVAAGLLFGLKSFVWAFLLAFIANLFVPDAGVSMAGVSMVSAWLTDSTVRALRRRKQIA
jgi:hypothetical protein